MATAWKPRHLTGEPRSPLNVFNSAIGKVCKNNFDAMADLVVGIDAAAGSEELTTSVVSSFVKIVMMHNENDEMLVLYAKMLYKMRKGWSKENFSNFQKKLNVAFQDIIEEFKKADSPSDEFTLEVYSVCKFISLMYIEEVVDVMYILAVLEKLRRSYSTDGYCKDNCVILFTKIFASVKPVLCLNNIYIAKLDTIYKTFFLEVDRSGMKSPSRYSIKEMLEKW